MISLSCISLQTMQRVPIPSESVICLGNFDGVHIAHRMLLRHGKRLRDDAYPNASCAVFCFSEPPSDLLSLSPQKRIYTLEQKLECFREEDIDHAIIAEFSELYKMTPKQFVDDVLKKECGCIAAVCGFNYRFGSGGSGTPERLSSLLEGSVSIIPQITESGVSISSTKIRQFISEGKIEEANAMLTKPFSFSAPVLHGKALGRKLGFPTINQTFPTKNLIPLHGVYLTACELENRTVVYGVSNVGTRPTVDQNTSVNCETYLLDFDGDLYGQNVRVSFLRRIRNEIKFENVSVLQQQVQIDIALARKLLHNITD